MNIKHPLSPPSNSKFIPGKPAPTKDKETKTLAGDAKPKTHTPKLDGSGKPFITLVQMLKREKLVESGGAAKHRVRAGGIQVNGSEELRPGRKLHAGDKVRIDGRNLDVQL